MKFSKFVRQNSRTLLMIVMALLLVAFLIPGTISQIGSREGALDFDWGSVYGRTVDNRTLDHVRADAKLLAQLGLLPGFSEQGALTYYLLMQETQRRGIRFSREEVIAYLRDMKGFTNDVLQEVQRGSGRSYSNIYDVVAQWMAVQRLIILQTRAIVDSVPRQELAYRDGNQDAVAKLTVLDDRAFHHLVPDPTEDELLAFFEECKDRVTAHTEDELKFGYKLPDRVQIEYVTIDPQQVKSHITVQAVQAKRFFEENAQRYTKPDPVATQPVDGKVPQVPMTFDEARDRVREDCREAKAVETAQRLINDVYSKLHQPWSGAAREEDGFLAPPAGEPLSMEQVAQEFSQLHKIEYHKTDLISGDELQRLAGLGAASVQVGRQTLRAPELAMRVKGLLAKDPNDGKPILNLTEPAPVVFSTRPIPGTQRTVPYQPFVFRVVAVAPAAPPDSIETVRKQLTQDWKTVRAHELARSWAEKLAAQARAMGLAAAVEQATELKDVLKKAEELSDAGEMGPPSPNKPPPQYVQSLQPYQPSRLRRQGGFVERLGRTTKVAETLFALAGTQTTETEPYRVSAIPAATLQKWVVAELVEIKPLYSDPFQAQFASVVQGSATGQDQSNIRFYTDWVNPDHVKQRTGFIPAAVPTAPGRAPATP